MLEELSFEEMLNKSFNDVYVGKTIKGTVMTIDKEEAVLDINYKYDAVLTANEYSEEKNVDLTEVLKIGESLEVKILKINEDDNNVLVSKKKLVPDEVFKELQNAYETGQILKGVISKIIKKGVIVYYKNINVFIPFSLVDNKFIKDLAEYKDLEVEFRLLEFNLEKNRIIGNRKVVLEENKAEMKNKLLSKFKEGDLVEGKVKNIIKYGVFVDVEGVDCLLHISSISWKKVENINDFFKIGDTVKAYIKEIKDKRISLSTKFEEDNPWNDIKDKLVVDNVIKGKVSKTVNYGFFIEIKDGVVGLVHVYQMPKKIGKIWDKIIKIGDEINVKILEYDSKSNKLKLSIIDVEQDEKFNARLKEKETLMEKAKENNKEEELKEEKNIDESVKEVKEKEENEKE